tara:strand:+ start:456 stop:839 length:384 start_codon:yes stop_codon:yes gene_type:complete
MGYKMKGFSGFGNSPAKQKKEKHFLLRDKEGPIATDDDTKEGNVSAYFRKNKQHVDKDKTITLSPGYEDTEKIQKVQGEGITPHSQEFGKFKALKEVKIWRPAFEGADHSKEELEKMSKKEKKDYYE